MLDSYLIPISERQKHLTYEHHIFRPFFVSNSISASCSGFLCRPAEHLLDKTPKRILCRNPDSLILPPPTKQSIITTHRRAATSQTDPHRRHPGQITKAASRVWESSESF